MNNNMYLKHFNMEVMSDVLKACEEHFQEEDVDNSVLKHLKELWTAKLLILHPEQRDTNIIRMPTITINDNQFMQLDGNATDSEDHVESSNDTESSDEMSVTEEETAVGNETEETLNSDDDLSDDILDDTDNVIVCQYNKITRNRRRWILELKNGIMNLNNKEYIFNQAKGYTTW